MTQVVSSLNVHSGLDFALRQSNWINAFFPTAGGSAVSQQAPDKAKYVLFSGNGDFYCLITPLANGSAIAAAVPGAAITDGTAAELNPAMRMLPDAGLSYISIISPSAGATVVTAQYFTE